MQPWTGILSCVRTRGRRRRVGAVLAFFRHARRVYRRPPEASAVTRWRAAALLGSALLGGALLGGGAGADAGDSRDARLQVKSFRNLTPLGIRTAYPALDALFVEGRVVPGLHRRFVPQGIDHLRDDSDRAVISGYFCERFQRAPWYDAFIRRCVRKHSGVYLYDLEAGRALRLALLKRRDGEPLRWHAGGVAVLFDHLWIPDNFQVARFDLARLTEAEEEIVGLAPDNRQRIGVDSSGDFITAHADALWIGNFQRKGGGAPLPAHYLSLEAGTSGWTAAYRIDPETLRPRNEARYEVRWAGRAFEVYRPDTALHHRNKVQGMSFIGERRLVLSASWGDAPSAFAFHLMPDEPLARQERGPRVELPDGAEIPIWSAHDPTREIHVSGPPGSEGIAFDGETLLTVFEGGAMPYRQRWGQIEDRMIRFLPPGITRRDAEETGPTP
jgi:hypothetical protein